MKIENKLSWFEMELNSNYGLLYNKPNIIDYYEEYHKLKRISKRKFKIIKIKNKKYECKNENPKILVDEVNKLYNTIYGDRTFKKRKRLF